MATEITVPNFPESVTDGTLVAWRKKSGDAVQRDEIVADIETDKVVFEVPAVADGVLGEIVAQEGSTVVSGQVIAHLDAGSTETTSKPAAKTNAPAPIPAAKTNAPASPQAVDKTPVIAPAAKKLIEEHGLNAGQIQGSGKDGRILKEDVLVTMEQRSAKASQAATAAPAAKPAAPAVKEPVRAPVPPPAGDERPQRRVPMTRLRARVAERLVAAQRTAAALTTFNEINMQPVVEMRERYREAFEKEHGVKLGFMSFFVKASIEALKRFPAVNASIDGLDIVYHGFFDIGVAVSSPRGLVVPIVRDADQLSMANIESRIKELSEKARTAGLAMEDISGGTFTITNGGVFGSLLSTPILNPPQSAILGMHKIEPRPMAENGQVVIRPMMYVALTYDHRLVDGREAVQFLVTIKELLEDPNRMLIDV
jgi:2-oxoglutarate dehydrogenase E2 component (dihydrolipoamide succinyltransferase)